MQTLSHMGPDHSTGDEARLSDDELDLIRGGEGQVPTGEYLVFTIPNASAAATGYFRVRKSGGGN